MQIIQKEITRSDFEKACKLNNLEYFTSDQVESWLKDSKTLIEKSQTEELDDIEKSLVDEFTVTAPNLNLVSVLNDDLTKSVMYVRPSQIDWDKDENGDLMKAKSGTYSDTPENRKLGRMGQKYGGSKGEEKKGSDKKPLNAPNIKESLAKDYHSGKITLKKVAEELHEAGHTNFVDTVYAGKIVDKFKKEGGEEKKGKSTEASKVLQLMDKDSSYKEAVDKVVKETGVDRSKLEKELDQYI